MKKREIFFYIGILVIILALKELRDNYRASVLKNSLKTYAIVVSTPSGSARGGTTMRFSFKNKLNETVKITWGGSFVKCRDNIAIGDTIYIRYSQSNNNVAEVIQFYWNDKLREDFENQ